MWPTSWRTRSCTRRSAPEGLGDRFRRRSSVKCPEYSRSPRLARRAPRRPAPSRSHPHGASASELRAAEVDHPVGECVAHCWPGELELEVDSEMNGVFVVLVEPGDPSGKLHRVFLGRNAHGDGIALAREPVWRPADRKTQTLARDRANRHRDAHPLGCPRLARQEDFNFTWMVGSKARVLARRLEHGSPSGLQCSR